jgi:hypothetical protein
MKIEFRKIPTTKKEFFYESNSVKFCGTLDRISSKLIDINSEFNGNIEVSCCKCDNNFNIPFREKINFLVSDGIYLSTKNRNLDKIIIEIDDGFIDFEEIFQSEIESFISDYYICNNCNNKDRKYIEIEY